MSITPRQARAARALLAQGQKQISEVTGISVNQISNFEQDKVGLSAGNLDKIAAYFEGYGLQLIDGGVRERPDDVVRVLDGREGFAEFMDDVYHTTKKQGGNICASNVNERHWIKWMGKDGYAAHAARMNTLNNFRFQILVEEGDTFFIASDIAEYRWLPSESFNDQSFYSYGGKLGIILFGDNAVKIIIVEQPEVGEGFRHLFNIQWSHLARTFS